MIWTIQKQVFLFSLFLAYGFCQVFDLWMNKHISFLIRQFPLAIQHSANGLYTLFSIIHCCLPLRRVKLIVQFQIFVVFTLESGYRTDVSINEIRTQSWQCTCDLFYWWMKFKVFSYLPRTFVTSLLLTLVTFSCFPFSLHAWMQCWIS